MSEHNTLEKFANELREQQWEMKLLIMNLTLALASEVYWANRYREVNPLDETSASRLAAEAIARQLVGIKVEKLVTGVVEDMEIVAGMQARTGLDEKRALIRRFRELVKGEGDATEQG